MGAPCAPGVDCGGATGDASANAGNGSAASTTGAGATVTDGVIGATETGGATGTAGATAVGGTTDNSSGMATPVSDAEGVPCELRAILTDRCGTCHGDPAQFGAPMPLTSQADFAAPAVSDASRSVWQLVQERVHTTDTKAVMPPAGQPVMSAEELVTLDAWLADGSPYVEANCATAPSEPDAGVDASEPPINPDLECYTMLAHAQGDKQKPFDVGVARDAYRNFTFAAPWGNRNVYAHTIAPVIDNDQALHHWLLYKNSNGSGDGNIENSSGAHPSGELMYGWAPGGETLNLDRPEEDVGMILEGDRSYTVEVHYNSSDASAVDASGVEVCVSEDAPEHLAARAWLGTDSINGTTATGTCRPNTREPIHILGVDPHMHKKGVHMKGVINRADGSTEILHDSDFDFNYQVSYRKDVWLMPGDSITTTCTYGEYATFGQGTDQEMCYLFTLHSPAGSLVQGGLGGIIHGENACL